MSLSWAKRAYAILTKYAAYYNELRTHRSLGEKAPIHRAIQHQGRMASGAGRRWPSPPLFTNLVFGTDSWQQYYGRFRGSVLKPVWRSMNLFLIRWLMRKHKRLAGRKTRAAEMFKRLAQSQPGAFIHWSLEILS